MAYYPIDETIFGLTEEQQSVGTLNHRLFYFSLTRYKIILKGCVLTYGLASDLKYLTMTYFHNLFLSYFSIEMQQKQV